MGNCQFRMNRMLHFWLFYFFFHRKLKLVSIWNIASNWKLKEEQLPTESIEIKLCALKHLFLILRWTILTLHFKERFFICLWFLAVAMIRNWYKLTKCSWHQEEMFCRTANVLIVALLCLSFLGPWQCLRTEYIHRSNPNVSSCSMAEKTWLKHYSGTWTCSQCNIGMEH